MLFIGNRHLLQRYALIFDKLAAENGQPAEIFSITAGGHYFRQKLHAALLFIK